MTIEELMKKLEAGETINLNSVQLTETTEALAKTFAGLSRSEALEAGKCVMCGEKHKGFRDVPSEREYNISAICQTCQDGMFEQ